MHSPDHNRSMKPWIAGLGLAVLLAGCDAGPPTEEADVADAPAAGELDTPPAEDATVAPTDEVAVAPMPPPPTDADTTAIPVDVIIVTPAEFLGQPVVGTAQVVEVPSDRGFWVENNGERIFAVVAQSPGMEQAVNVEPGQTVRLAGLVYDSALASGIAGQVDPQAMQTIADQPAFLLVPAANITVAEAPAE